MSAPDLPPPHAGPSAERSRAVLRVSDADRERCAIALRDHAAEGRLDPDELDQRLGAAYAARTHGELDALLVDLPAIQPAPGDTPPERLEARRDLHRQLLQQAGLGAGAVVVCVAVWLASGASGSFWPVWVIVIVAIGLASSAWRGLGPGGDPERELARRAERERERRRHRA